MGTLLGLTAGQRAVHLNANGQNGALVRLIERTPDAYILYNQIMFFLPCHGGHLRATLIGDAAHVLPPCISAGEMPGVEDMRVRGSRRAEPR